MTDTIRRLVWSCEHCGKPIADGKGSLFIRGRELKARRDAWAEHERKKHARAREERDRTGKDRVLIITPLSELRDLPSATGWRARHSRCGLYSLGDIYYEIEVRTLRTESDVIRWTAHLLDKEWLIETDWSQVLYGVSKQTDEATA